MIISFRHKGLELFYKTESTKGIQAEHAPKLKRILSLLEVASSLLTLKFHPLGCTN